MYSYSTNYSSNMPTTNRIPQWSNSSQSMPYGRKHRNVFRLADKLANQNIDAKIISVMLMKGNEYICKLLHCKDILLATTRRNEITSPLVAPSSKPKIRFTSVYKRLYLGNLKFFSMAKILENNICRQVALFRRLNLIKNEDSTFK